MAVGMIRHLVTFQLAATRPAQRAQDAAELRDRLVALSKVIPEVISLDVYFDVGRIDGHWDAVLVADYASNEDLETYQRHPEHAKVMTFTTSVSAQRAVIDFEL